MKEITIEWLQKKEACSAGIDFFRKQENHEVFATLERQKENNPQWMSWLLTRMLTKKQNIQYAIFAAEQVKEYLKKPSKKNKVAAAYAAAAADACADAAADAATDATAYACADAAYAAAYAADAAAYDAVYACANAATAVAYAVDTAKEMQIKILNYGIKLLKGE